MKKEKLIIEYLKNYLKYYERTVDNDEDSYIFYHIRKRIEEIEILNEEKIKKLNEIMNTQLEG